LINAFYAALNVPDARLCPDPLAGYFAANPERIADKIYIPVLDIYVGDPAIVSSPISH